jgi:hypothetical protein
MTLHIIIQIFKIIYKFLVFLSFGSEKIKFEKLIPKKNPSPLPFFHSFFTPEKRMSNTLKSAIAYNLSYFIKRLPFGTE